MMDRFGELLDDMQLPPTERQAAWERALDRAHREVAEIAGCVLPAWSELPRRFEGEPGLGWWIRCACPGIGDGLPEGEYPVVCSSRKVGYVLHEYAITNCGREIVVDDRRAGLGERTVCRFPEAPGDPWPKDQIALVKLVWHLTEYDGQTIGSARQPPSSVNLGEWCPLLEKMRPFCHVPSSRYSVNLPLLPLFLKRQEARGRADADARASERREVAELRRQLTDTTAVLAAVNDRLAAENAELETQLGAAREVLANTRAELAAAQTALAGERQTLAAVWTIVTRLEEELKPLREQRERVEPLLHLGPGALLAKQ